MMPNAMTQAARDPLVVQPSRLHRQAGRLHHNRKTPRKRVP